MLFRPHRGSLHEAMTEVEEIESKFILVSKFAKDLDEFGIEVTDEKLKIKPYGYDDRINWDTYIVTIDGFGVVGFTNGDLK